MLHRKEVSYIVYQNEQKYRKYIQNKNRLDTRRNESYVPLSPPFDTFDLRQSHKDFLRPK